MELYGMFELLTQHAVLGDNAPSQRDPRGGVVHFLRARHSYVCVPQERQELRRTARLLELRSDQGDAEVRAI